ncbi:MAG TPA: hypothetical protein DIW64_07890 [Cellvibrio sp.]|nr:hypothetical protein [Cellvibrio sp.]
MENQVLINFLEKNGLSLSEFGSSEYGLTKQNCLNFIKLLASLGGKPIGIEVWKKKQKKYFIDSLAGWYSESSDREECIKSAINFALIIDALEADLMTVQYEE